MLVSSRELIVEWGDCDPAGIVFFPRYSVWFDASTHLLFHRAGCAMWDLQGRYGMHGLPTVEVRSKFYVPSRPGEVVRIDSTIAEFRRSSFDVYHRLMKGDDLAVEGWEARVWVAADPSAKGQLKSRPIPEEVKARFAA